MYISPPFFGLCAQGAYSGEYGKWTLVLAIHVPNMGRGCLLQTTHTCNIPPKIYAWLLQYYIQVVLLASVGEASLSPLASHRMGRVQSVDWIGLDYWTHRWPQKWLIPRLPESGKIVQNCLFSTTVQLTICQATFLSSVRLALYRQKEGRYGVHWDRVYFDCRTCEHVP